MDVQQSRNFRIILPCLLASLLLHGFFLLVVALITPKPFQKQSTTANIVMIDLAVQAHQNTVASGSVQTLPVAQPNKELSRPLTQTVPIPAITPLPDYSISPEKRNAPPQNPGSPLYSKAAITSHQPPNTGGHPASAGHSQPQELAFGSASGPAFIKQAAPVYPALAKRRSKQGSVLLRLSISETGQLTQVEVLEDPGYGFAEAAQEAVRGSSFTPAHHNGKPVAIRAILPVRFMLR